MEIIELKISEIKPYLKNAKEHKESQVKKIANSIKEFGFNQPIVIDKNNVIIVGHGRYIAALSLGMESVPTLTVELDEERAKSYRLADNRLNESEWDMDIVIEELKGLSLEMIDLTGFNSNLTLETVEDNPDLSNIGKVRSKEGDLYQLGEHKLICGDACKYESYKKLLGNEKAQMIFTDPPYSVDYVSSAGLSYNSVRYGGTGGRIFNDNKTPEEALKFYKETLSKLYNYSLPDATIYWWFASRLTNTNMQAFTETKWHFSQICFWLKNSLVYSVGQLYHRIYEPCMVGWKQGQTCYKDKDFASFTEFWNLDNKKFQDYLDVWYQKRDNVNKYIHPTQKPVQLAERAIKRSSRRGDIVLDAFGGSGSTLIACEQLGRRCRMIELDPKYIDACVTRYCQYKGDSKIIKNGKEITWI